MRAATLTLLAALAAAWATLASPAQAQSNGQLASRGKLIVAIMPNYPPMDLRDPATGELAGFDVDFMAALAPRLGIAYEWQETRFEQMISALKTGRVDLVFSMTDLPSRHDSATFIDYTQTGPQFFVQAARAPEFADLIALCGKAVGASRVTNYPKQIAEWSERNCAGKPPIRVVGTEGSVDARAQLRQGRIAAAVQGNETLPWILMQEPNTYAMIGTPIGKQLTGMLVRTDDATLRDALVAGVDALIADGTYAKLLAKWNLGANGLEKATINAGQ